MMQMANENLKAQKIYGKYIKDLPQVTEVNDTDDIIIEDSTPVTNRAKLGVLFDSIKKMNCIYLEIYRTKQSNYRGIC